MVYHTMNISIIKTFRLSEHLNFGAGQKGSDNGGWIVAWDRKPFALKTASSIIMAVVIAIYCE